jgi:PAS domain S-box-containing protein
MRAPSYETMSKRDLIDRLVEAERQLRTVAAEKGPDSAPAARRCAESKSGTEEHPVPGAVRKEAKRARPARPAGAEIKSASESDYTVLDGDGRIRRLYRVVKDIRDDSGQPVFSEGALYEIGSKTTAEGENPDAPAASDQTELICRFQPNGTLTYVNEAYCRYFGCEKAEMQGRNMLLSISEADREKVYSRLRDLRPERPVDTLEYRVESVFGEVLWNQWTYRALFDDNGNVLEYQSVGRDITFRKYTQDVLEKRAAILEAVTFAAEGFLKNASWRERIERVLERFGAAMNASHVFLCENRIGGAGDIAVLRSYEWLSPDVGGDGDRQKFLRDSELAVRFSEWVYAKSEGRPIYGSIGNFPDQVVGDLKLDKHLSIAVVPILSGDRWWGFIGFADYTGDTQWNEDEIAPLVTASEILGAAIEREVKERALAETHATIRDQEQFLAGVFDAIQDGIMVASPDMTILRVNKTLERRFSHAEQLVGRKCYEAYYGLESPCAGCASQKTLETGKLATMTRAVTGPGGEARVWVEVFSYPWVDHDTGKLKGVIEYSRDITEKKRAEEARRQSEERLQTFLNSFRDPVFLKDHDRRYLIVNDAGLSLLGRTREEILGKTDGEMFDAADPAEIEKEKTDIELLTRDGGPLLYEQQIRGRLLETTKFRVNLEDGLIGIGGILRDVTEQREAAEKTRRSEELLRMFVDSSKDHIFLKDEQGRNILVNQSVTEFLGRTREQTIGKTDAELLPAAQAERSSCTDRKVLAAGMPLSFQDTEQGRIFEVTKFPVRFSDDRTGIGGILRDVTESVRVQEALRESESLQKMLLQSIDAGVLIIDAKTHFIERANSKALEMFGGTEESVIGRKCQQHVCPAEKGSCPVTDLGQEVDRSERILLTSDGGRVPIIKTARRIRIAGEEKILETFVDITGLKEAEEALRASEARYRELADTIPVGVYESDLEGNVFYVNRTAREMFGYGDEEISPSKKVNFLQILASEERGTAIANARRVREEMSHVIQEYTFARQDGSRFTGLVTSRPVIRDGQVTGSRGVCTDISPLKDAQRALRENEAMLRSIMRAAPVGIAFGINRTLQWSNDYYQRMTGYGEDDVKGRTARALYDNEEEFLRIGTALYGSQGKEGTGEAITRWTRRDGSVIDVHLNVSPLYSDNVAAGVVITALDITEQKKADEALRASESRYRELADNMPAGIYEATLDGCVTYANRAAQGMFGFGADEVERGVPFTEVIAPESWEDLVRNVKRIRDGETFDFEYAMLRRDGSRFVGLNLARPVIRDGRVAGTTGVVTDVTELRKVQEALRKNEALLGGMLQAAPIGVGMVRDRVMQWVNEGMTSLTGYQVDELRDKSARMLYPDDEEFERAGREKYEEIRSKGKGSVETRWKRKDGTVIDVHLSSAPIDPLDLSVGVVFTALDITVQKKASRILLYAKEDLEKQVSEQTRELDVTNMLLRIELEEHRKTEEALVNSEQLYRAIVEDQTEIICRFRPDGTITFVNEAFCRYFGKGRDEVLGTRYLPTIPHEDRRRLWSAYGGLAPHRPVFHQEFRIEMPGGKARWLHWTNRAVYDDSGSLIEHQGVARDITERIGSEQQIRESRNMLRSVFDGISDPLIMVREDMTLVMLNRAALRFFGALLYRDMIGTPCLEFFRGRYGESATRLVQAGIAEQEPARHELAAQGESARYEEVFVYPVAAGVDRSGLAIIRVSDRTKQRLLERELIQSEKMASLGLLISGIVHEINNPNNFISFNIPILRDYLREILPVLDEYAARTPDYEVQGMPYADFRADVLKLLENIEHGSVRINTTVAKLKEFAHKKDEKGIRPILPSKVAERAVSICHTQIRKTVKTFDVQVQPDLPEMASDPDAIEQTLINLLINAAQAADKPDSRILLSVRQGANGEGLSLEVRDNGSGMDGKTVSRIFDPFFTTKEEGLGTGLGLYISKNLIEAAGGSITVESEPGRGTIFRVVMPDLNNPDNRKKPFMEKGVDS